MGGAIAGGKAMTDHRAAIDPYPIPEAMSEWGVTKMPPQRRRTVA